MSAQKTPRRGVFSAIIGLLGFSALAGLLVTVMVAPAVAVTGITASSTIGVFDSLPEYLEIGQQPERNEIYATSGSSPYLIATIYNQNRQEVPYEQISPFALQAAVDGEDRRFFEHGGVDVSSVIRAGLDNVTHSEVQSGASTLSMQLVKNIFMQAALEEPTPEERDKAYKEATATTFERKLSEMKYAIGLEKKYTKKEILTAYLNIAFFGDNTYGIQAAAQRYYGVNAKDLTLPQAASLIAIVQYPGLRSLDDPEHYGANTDRRDAILDSMLGVGDITEAEHDEAVAVVTADTLNPQPPSSGCLAGYEYARWFCDYVTKSIKDFTFLGDTPEARETNWARGGYKLYTTLDLDAQTAAQQSTWTYAPNTEDRFQLGSATTSVEPGTGRVLVMAENKLYDNTIEGGGPTTTAVNFNTATAYGGSSGFAVGSSYKLFTLLDWLAHGKGVNEKVNGSGRTVDLATFRDRCEGAQAGPYKFKNDHGTSGYLTIRDGTVQSINGVFISMAQQLDLCDIHELAANLGVERADGTPLHHNVSAIIGAGNEITPISMATAYAAVAAQGLACKPIIVDKAVGPDGSDLGGQPHDCHQVISPDVANTAIDVLKGVMKGSASPKDGVPVFGKTGTTNGAVQTWIIGSTTKAATATWVGNIVGDFNILNTRYAGVSGEVLRNWIMADTLRAISAKFGGNDWPGPSPALLTGSGATIPDVRGQTAEGAKALLEGLGFTFADGGPIDSELEAGRVASTDPAAGAETSKGATVTVFTSKGNMVAFPDVVGDGKSFSFNQAQGNLHSAGYPNVTQSCMVLTPNDANPGPGGGVLDPLDPRINKVQSTNPAPGTYVLPGGTVAVTIGKPSC